MTAPVIIEGTAVIFDRETGDVVRCSVPTAVENVTNGNGRFVHGDEGELLASTAIAAPSASDAPIQLQQDGVLPLPEEPVLPTVVDPMEKADEATRDAIANRLRPVDNEHAHVPSVKDGPEPKAGRSAEEEAERAELFATFKTLGVKVFAGSTTEKLRAKLAEIEADTAPK